ncbi:hypothetical protein [Faecalibaculum rodentium]|uniref:hypothetical protein n=1 Tax=Faecalibaculum rodentium TaxID=1702221 RepID=UPI0026F3D899|nr:hypothetical protein [Faecalibaculum rodentium]
MAEFEQGLDWIIKAGIALPSYNVTEPQIPLELNEKRSLFRLFFLDTGLLCSCYPGIQLPILQNEADANWTFAQPVVFCTGNVHEQDGILYLPWYMLMFLEPEPVPSFSFEALDLPL